MTSRAWRAGLCLALTLAVTPAWAEACRLQKLASLDMTPLGPGGRVTVPVSFNGVSRPMLLATADDISMLTQPAVKALGLHVGHSDNVRLLGSNGSVTENYVTIETLGIGTLMGSHMDLMVSANANAGQGPAFDGQLGGDLLSHYDVEMDFAGRKLNYFAPAHCDGSPVYWPAPVQAEIPISLARPIRSGPGMRPQSSALPGTRIRVQVTLEGKEMSAVINTASATSTMTAATAKTAFGVAADSPGSVPLGDVAGDPGQKVFGHIFSSLSFGGVTVNNPRVLVHPDLIGAKDRDNNITTGSHITREDDGLGSPLTIGMDVLKHLHLYIAYRDNKMYVTPAAEAAPPAAP